MKNTRILYVIIGLVGFGLIAYVLFLGWQSRDKTATIDIQSAVPTDIHVTIDGQQVSANGKVGVKPGSHTVDAQRSGFEGKTQTVEAKANETATVRLLLAPNGQEGYDWARNHPDEFREYEELKSKQFDENSASMTAKSPLVGQLPYLRPTWRIDYGTSVAHPNDPNAVAITITYASDVDKKNAEDWIISQGYKLSDYEIIYKAASSSAN